MSDLHALAERLEKATGPDRELEALLARTLGGFAEVYRAIENGVVVDALVDHGDDDIDTCPRYTASIDAAVALCERALPGRHWRVEKSCEYPGLAFRAHQFTGWCGDYGAPSRADAPTPALALCLAVVRAKIAEQAND